MDILYSASYYSNNNTGILSIVIKTAKIMEARTEPCYWNNQTTSKKCFWQIAKLKTYLWYHQEHHILFCNIYTVCPIHKSA